LIRSQPARLTGAPGPALARSWGGLCGVRSSWLRSFARSRRPYDRHDRANLRKSKRRVTAEDREQAVKDAVRRVKADTSAEEPVKLVTPDGKTAAVVEPTVEHIDPAKVEVLDAPKVKQVTVTKLDTSGLHRSDEKIEVLPPEKVTVTITEENSSSLGLKTPAFTRGPDTTYAEELKAREAKRADKYQVRTHTEDTSKEVIETALRLTEAFYGRTPEASAQSDGLDVPDFLRRKKPHPTPQ
jgi:hypothetical protein